MKRKTIGQAEYTGLKHDSWRTKRQILNAIDKCDLFDKYYNKHMGHYVRSFKIKE